MAAAAKLGIIEVRGAHSVDEKVQKLTEILETKGLKLLALIDHSGEAEKAGMKMAKSKTT